LEAYNKVIADLKGKLSTLEAQDLDIYIKTEEAATICNQILVELQDLVFSQSFKCEANEIEFFKFLKPKVVSKLIYHIEYFNIQFKLPKGLKKHQIKYLNEQIVRLQKYFTSNSEFYHYYLKKETIHDDFYFLRKNKKVRLNIESYLFFTEHKFSTNHDNTMAIILAYEKLIKKLHDDIENLSVKNINTIPSSKTNQKQNKINWTGTKTDLIELIYALHSSGAINNGNVEIKDMAILFQEMFNIDLGNYYHSFVEMRTRKINQTKFLDKLKDNFTQYIMSLDALN